MTEIALLIAGAAVGLVTVYLVWRGLTALTGFLNGDDMFDDGEW